MPVLAEAGDAAGALREFDLLLFEHVVDVGLGVLACRAASRTELLAPIRGPRVEFRAC